MTGTTDHESTEIAHPEFSPDPSLTHEAMAELQREIAEMARFEDDLTFDPDSVTGGDAADLTTGVPDPVSPERGHDVDPDAPIVVGVDQAFLDEEVISAIVATQDGAVIERTYAISPLTIPYIPGLLAFREGGPILDAFETLSVDPDLAVFDGSGRIHYRQAGIATHVGVILDLPSLGVAKRLLCGDPDADVSERPEGWSTPIRATDDVEAPNGTVLGHAFQSRQYSKHKRINPLYVSPGNRLSAKTTVNLVEHLCTGYKLPKLTRLADAYADDVKRSIASVDGEC